MGNESLVPVISAQAGNNVRQSQSRVKAYGLSLLLRQGQCRQLNPHKACLQSANA